MYHILNTLPKNRGRGSTHPRKPKSLPRSLIKSMSSAADYFTFFSLPRKLHLDTAALEKNFYTLSRKLHPDRFAARPARGTRRRARPLLALNDAYRTLRDPILRTQYLLRLEGIQLEEQSRTPPTQPAHRHAEKADRRSRAARRGLRTQYGAGRVARPKKWGRRTRAHSVATSMPPRPPSTPARRDPGRARIPVVSLGYRPRRHRSAARSTRSRDGRPAQPAQLPPQPRPRRQRTALEYLLLSASRSIAPDDSDRALPCPSRWSRGSRPPLRVGHRPAHVLLLQVSSSYIPLRSALNVPSAAASEYDSYAFAHASWSKGSSTACSLRQRLPQPKGEDHLAVR